VTRVEESKNKAHEESSLPKICDRLRALAGFGAVPMARLKASRGFQLAISMSQMADRSATIYPSPVKGEGDDSFTLIWSRRNGD
jgi:hypothetical protein